MALGTGRAPDGPGVETRDLGHCVLLPGLINAHTHLELSWLWGKVPPAPSLPAWVSQLMAQRFARGADNTAPMRQAIIDALEAGTAAVGDVANTAASQRARSRLHGVVFREVVGFNPAESGGAARRRGAGRRGAPGAARRRTRRAACTLFGRAGRAAPDWRSRGA